MFPQDIQDLAVEVLNAARKAGLTVATAESCTGGLVAGALTAIPGSSDVFDRGFVTYSNEAKSQMLGVPAGLIDLHGAVSAEVAVAMAEGAMKASGAGLTVAVTGIAGPGGGSEAKPVGLVHFAVARTDRPAPHREMRFGDIGREAVRLASVRVAFEMLLEALR
ncbi:MAG TPA: CinA family protein [Caulobacteraceae bacterium]|nr:CinA family protein [Caulobacteraceae bacterium]